MRPARPLGLIPSAHASEFAARDDGSSDRIATPPQRAGFATGRPGMEQPLAHRTAAVSLALAILTAASIASAVDVRTGRIDDLSPTWDRIESTAPASPTCGMPSVDSQHDGVSYNAFPIRASVAESLVVDVPAGGTTLDDTVLALYCGAFDPASPATNLVAYDDDDGELSLSRFTAEDGVTLEPGVVYWLVLTTFAPSDVGLFEVRLESPTATFVGSHERSGSLGPGSTRWNRIEANNPSVDLACSLPVADAAADDVAFQAFPIRASALGNLEVEVVADAQTALADTVLALYCDPFDPLEPTANLVAVDDDDGPELLSRFHSSDGIALAPETTYWLVLTTFDAASYGTYHVRIHDPRISFVPEPGAGAGVRAALLTLWSVVVWRRSRGS